MLPKQTSLQQHAKQSHSINVNQIHYCDYINEQVKQNQITPFSSYHYQNPLQKTTQLKELNSNEQNRKNYAFVQKSTLQFGEVKLYRQRIQTLETRLKEKNNQLKLKQDEINRLNTINQELQQLKMQFLLQSSQKSLHFIRKSLSDPKDHKQVQTDSLQKAPKSFNSNNLSLSDFDEQAIELHFQLQKYRKKYSIIEQNLKKRVNEYESQLTSLNRKLKQEKQQNNHLQQQIFVLQQENINLKQKLQEAYQEIESLEQQGISQEIPSQFDIKNLQNNGRRFSFGDELKEVGSSNWMKQERPVFLNIFNEVSFSFVPEITQHTGRFKGQNQRKLNAYMIRLYPRMYEIKIIGNVNRKDTYDFEEVNKNKKVQYGCNTVQKRLQMSASVNIKVSAAVNDDMKKHKQKRNLRICSKEVTFQPNLSIRSQIMHRQIMQQPYKPERYRQPILLDSTNLDYKINARKNSQSVERNEIHQRSQKPSNIQSYKNSLERRQNVENKNISTKFKDLSHVQRPQIGSLNQNKDILQRINHHLKNSHLMSPKVQNFDDLSSRKQSMEPKFTRSRPSNNQTINLQPQLKYENLRPSVSHQSLQNKRQNPTNRYSDWIVDQINEQTNKILSKYTTSAKKNEITYHQSYPTSYHAQNNIDRSRDFVMKRSSSIQNLSQQQKTPSYLQNDKNLLRNMSLTSLDHIKLRQSLLNVPKSNTLKLNTTIENRQSLQLNKTQDIKDSRVNVPMTPSRQNSQKINPSISMKDLIAQKCKKLSII